MYSPSGWIARSAANEGGDFPVLASYRILRGEGRWTWLPRFAKQRPDFCIELVGVNDPHPWAVVKAKVFHRALGFDPVARGWIAVLQLADHMGGGHAQDIAGIDVENRQPNGMALGMDHLDAADQFWPVAAGPDHNQLARAEVHGARVVQTLKVAIALCQGPFGLQSIPQVPVMRKASNAMLSLVALTAAALAPFGQAASAATVLSIGDGDTISVLARIFLKSG